MFIMIIGGGKVGTRLAELLMAQGHRVKVIEYQSSQFLQLKQTLPNEVVVEGSGTDPILLENAGIRQASGVVAVTGNDETNLVVAKLARFDFQTPHIVRVNNPRNSWLFTADMGVDIAVDQASLISQLVMGELSLGDTHSL